MANPTDKTRLAHKRSYAMAGLGGKQGPRARAKALLEARERQRLYAIENAAKGKA